MKQEMKQLAEWLLMAQTENLRALLWDCKDVTLKVLVGLLTGSCNAYGIRRLTTVRLSTTSIFIAFVGYVFFRAFRDKANIII